jgi:type II secretory pathway pseudopilin PulG
MKPRRNTKAAFTLVEMIASVAILVTMCYLLFAAFNQTSKAWLQGESRVETFTAARAALDYMSRELAQAVVSSNWVGTSGLTCNGPGFFGTNSAVAFIAPAGDNYGSGIDMAEVVYRLSQPSAQNAAFPPTKDPGSFFIDVTPPYRLIRRFTPYSDFPSLAGYNYGQMTPSAGNPWDFYGNNNYNWMETSATNYTQVLADNIVSLSFQFVTTNGVVYNYWNSVLANNVWPNELPAFSIPNPTDPTAGLDANKDAGSYGAPYMTNHAPAGVIITIGAVDSRTATRLQALTSNGVTNNITAFTNLLNQATQIFTTYVAIPNQ